MSGRTFDYYGAKICIYSESDNGNVEAKIFPDDNNYSSFRGVFNKEVWSVMLNEIREGKLK